MVIIGPGVGGWWLLGWSGELGTYKFLNFLNFLEQFLFTILLGGEQFVFDNACFLLELLIFQLIDLRFDFGNFDCVLNERDQEKWKQQQIISMMIKNIKHN